MNKGHEIQCLDKGYVRLVDWLGNDLRIVESARISYKSPSKGEEQDKKLLFYLYKHRHCSPFEQCSITLNIKLPLFVQGQLVRHRTARLNQVSARYTEMKDEFYVPERWRVQDLKNKQGSLPNAALDDSILNDIFRQACSEAYSCYTTLLECGVAREMARMVLPQNLYTEIYWNCDIRNLMHFLDLRLDSHAQYEIQVYANAMYEIFAALFPWTAEAFRKYKFVVKENE